MTATCDCVEGCQLADRFTPATRELMVFTKSKKRYFDLDAVREGLSEHSRKYYVEGAPYLERLQADKSRHAAKGKTPLRADGGFMQSAAVHPGGVPPLDWWQIPSPKPQPVTEYQGDPMTATFYVGDAIETMNKLPEKSVDLVLTSPPFLALRSYLPTDHEDKHLEGGSQATPGEYINWLLDVVEACERVLAPHGSLCFELGDTYSGSGGAGGDYDPDGLRTGQPRFRQGADGKWNAGSESARINGAPGGNGWPLAKSLSLIPETFRFAMVYGVNPHTGRRTEPWRLRNVIRWVRPNPPVGALGDKFRPATSELMVFCKAKDRFFDLDAVRMPMNEHTLKHWESPGERKGIIDEAPRIWAYNSSPNPAGAPPLDWWNIPPGGYPGAHYAVWPPELLIKPIKAMCPEKVCRTCGEPSRRIVGDAEYERQGRWKRYDPEGDRRDLWVGPEAQQAGANTSKGVKEFGHITRSTPTLGWTDCSHDTWRPGIVLDPFAGSGTTLAIATGHGRDAIGIDLDERNYDLALDRVGPFILTRAAS